MRRWRPVFLCLLLILFITWESQPAVQTDGLLRYAMAEDGLLRLHVVAQDNSSEMQRVKLAVRDAVQAYANARFDNAVDSAQAFAMAQGAVEEIEDISRMAARACGYDGTVKAQTGEFLFPERAYGATVVPAGAYPALRVTLGEGLGRNWWCVLYPSLCALPLDGEGTDTGVILEWGVLSFFKRLFGWEA